MIIGHFLVMLAFLRNAKRLTHYLRDARKKLSEVKVVGKTLHRAAKWPPHFGRYFADIINSEEGHGGDFSRPTH